MFSKWICKHFGHNLDFNIHQDWEFTVEYKYAYCTRCGRSEYIFNLRDFIKWGRMIS